MWSEPNDFDNKQQKTLFVCPYNSGNHTLLLKGLFSRCFHCQHCITSTLLLSVRMILVDWYKRNAVWLAPLYWHACNNRNAFHSQEEEACSKNDGHRGDALCRLLGAFPSGLPPAWLRYQTSCALPSCLQLSVSQFFFLPLTSNEKNNNLLHICLSARCCPSCESKHILTSDSLLLSSSLTFRRGQHLVPVNLRQAIICSFIPLTVITMATIINLV